MILVGLGNSFRRDDGVGPALLQRLAQVESHYCEGDPLRLMAALDGQRGAVVVDAVSGTEPGRIHRWVWGETPPELLGPKLSSHAFSLFEALTLMENLQKLPPKVVIFGMEGEDFSWGTGFSSPVEQALSQLEILVRDEMAVD